MRANTLAWVTTGQPPRGNPGSARVTFQRCVTSPAVGCFRQVLQRGREHGQGLLPSALSSNVVRRGSVLDCRERTGPSRLNGRTSVGSVSSPDTSSTTAAGCSKTPVDQHAPFDQHSGKVRHKPRRCHLYEIGNRECNDARWPSYCVDNSTCISWLGKICMVHVGRVGDCLPKSGGTCLRHW